MNTRILLALFAVLFLHSSLALRTTAQMPLLPTTTGTYYYEGFDDVNNRYVFIAGVSSTDSITGEITRTGTYYYVDTAGAMTVGGTTEYPTTSPSPSPYRAVIAAGGTTNFQFYNTNPDLYSVTTSTSGTVVTTSTSYAVRSGTWSANDVTFNLDSSDASAIWLQGFTATGTNAEGVATYAKHPVVFTGSNINAIAVTSDTSSRQAVSLRSGAALYLYGGTIAKMEGSGTNLNFSETIYMVSNQEGKGSSTYFQGEDLTIVSVGNQLETFNMAAGNNVAKLYRSTISATFAPFGYTGTVNLSNGGGNVFLINGTADLGSNHFYGEDLMIDVTGTTTDRVLYLGTGGGNTFTLVNSTIIANIVDKTAAQDTFYLNDTLGQGGNHFTGTNVSIINHQGRTFVMGSGSNTITLVDSSVVANGIGAVFGWNATSASTGDRMEAGVFLENTNVTTTANYAPIFQQIGDQARMIVTGGTLTTTGQGSTILRLIAQNDNSDSTRTTAIFTNAVLDAQNASAIDLNIEAGNSSDYGQSGGGGKNIGTVIEDAYNIIVRSSTVSGGVAALRLAAAGSGTSTYKQHTNFFLYDSALIGGIQMVAGGYSNFTSGASLVLTASNSQFVGGMTVEGLTEARRDNQGILYVYDSEWSGDIALTTRGNLTLQFANTPIDGSLTLTGSSHVQLRLTDSPILGDISTGIYGTTEAMTAEVTGYVVGAGQVGSVIAHAGHIDLLLDSTPSGAVTASGTGAIALNIGGTVAAIPAGINLSGTSKAIIALRDAIEFTGDAAVGDRATFSLFTGKPNTNFIIHGNLDLSGIWHIPAATTLDGSLNLTSTLGTISMSDVHSGMLTLEQGLSGKGRLDILSIGRDAFNDDLIHVIKDETGSFASDTFILARPVDSGLFTYSLENRSDGAWLIGGFGTGGAAVVNSQSLAADEWFAALSSINYHLSDVRRVNDDGFAGKTNAPDRAQGDAGALWVQTRSETTRVDVPGTLRDFDARLFGVTVGADTRWDQDTGVFTMGIFVDTSRTDRDFNGTADGSTTAAGGGIYLGYHHRNGFFTSAVARFDTYKTTWDTHNPANAMRANYNTQALGLALDLGWRFNIGNDWWFEPAYQLGVVSLPGTAYVTDSLTALDIDLDDARATQNTFRFAMGKVINEKWSVRGHLAASSITASGGGFTATGLNNVSFMLDGQRVEASIGVSRQIGRAGRINLDVAYIEADSYERPCSISLGFNYLW